MGRASKVLLYRGAMVNRGANGQRRAARWWNWDAFWFIGLCIVCLVPVWRQQYFASTDGPSHVYNATAIARYFSPECPIYREYYAFNPFPVPNWAGHAVIALFATVTAPAVAEKLFLTLYVILLPLAMRYAVAARNPGNHYAPLLVFPFVHGTALLAGWYNFSISLVVWLFALGFWLRHGQGGRPLAPTLSLLFLLLYLAHPVSLGACVLALVLLGLWSMARDRRRAPGAWPGDGARPLRTMLLCAAPFLLMLALFALQNNPLEGQSPGGFGPSTGWHVFQVYAMNSAMGPLTTRELLLTTAFGFFLWSVFAATLRPRAIRLDPGRLGLLALVVVLVLLSFLVPDRFGGGGNLGRRLAILAWMTVLLWVGTHDFGRMGRSLIRLVAVAATVTQVGIRAPVLAEVEEYHQGVVEAGSSAEPRSAIVTLAAHEVAFPNPHYIPILVRESAAYLAAERCLVDVTNYEGQVGSFPLVTRAGLPRVHRTPGSVAGALRAPAAPWILLSEYPAQMTPALRPAADRTMELIAATCDLVSTTHRGGIHRLYRQRAP
jgi:hypothetical protein